MSRWSAGASWPDAARRRAFTRFMLRFYVVFFPVYFGAGHLAAASGRSNGLYFDWESQIPLLACMIWPYLSLFPLFLLPLLYMSPGSIARLSVQSTFALLAAGAAFLAFPARLGFVSAPVAGVHAPLFALISRIDTPHNLAPSLHVTFGALLLLGCAQAAPRIAAAACYAWLAVMSASTLLVHQHHVIDVLSGLALALGARWAAPLTPRGGG